MKDVVCFASEYLECQPILVFAIAHIYAKEKPTREETETEIELWRKSRKIPTFVQDFCIDVLAKRLVVEITLEPQPIIELRRA